MISIMNYTFRDLFRNPYFFMELEEYLTTIDLANICRLFKYKHLEKSFAKRTYIREYDDFYSLAIFHQKYVDYSCERLALIKAHPPVRCANCFREHNSFEVRCYECEVFYCTFCNIEQYITCLGHTYYIED